MTFAEASAFRRAINLGRSVLGASRIYELGDPGQGTRRTKSAQFARSRCSTACRCRGWRSGDDRSRRRSRRTRRKCPERNAPSRWRLRPAFRLTAAEATADRRAINLGRSVLGASPMLGGLEGCVKVTRSELFANCEIFFSHRVDIAHRCACSRRLRERNRGGRCRAPVSDNPAWPAIRRAGNAFVHRPDRPSASAYSCSGGFVLPAPRARRRQESTKTDTPDQGRRRTNRVQFANVSQPIQACPFQYARTCPCARARGGARRARRDPELRRSGSRPPRGRARTPGGADAWRTRGRTSSPAAARTPGPHVDRSAVLLDVLAYARSRDDLTLRSLGCRACVTARGPS